MCAAVRTSLVFHIKRLLVKECATGKLFSNCLSALLDLLHLPQFQGLSMSVSCHSPKEYITHLQLCKRYHGTASQPNIFNVYCMVFKSETFIYNKGPGRQRSCLYIMKRKLNKKKREHHI